MGIFTATRSQTPAAADATNPLVELLPETDLAAFFTQATGLTPDPTYFGIYAVEGVDEELFLGFGAARPAEKNGALLAKTDGKTLSVVCQPAEQGFVGMRYSGDTLYIPGPDPTEDWTLGNVYTGCPPERIVKHRNLPNVVHTWGLYPHAAAGRLYAAVGRHAGDNQTFFGGVFISEDGGASWSAVDDPKHVLGDYRTYDITQFGDTLYATVNDDYERPAALARSSDAGKTWKRINTQVECRPRLLATRDYLAALRADREGLCLISPQGRVSRTRFREFTAAQWSYNYLCAGYGGWYYLLADGGCIYNSRDLKTWTLVVETGLNLLAVGYWQARNWLIVADRGAGAGLWRLDLALYGAV